MGTRINYEIGDLPSVILFSNSHHHTEHPDEVFRALVTEHGISQTALTRALLNTCYMTSCGQHHAGDAMFSVDLNPTDRTEVLRVVYSNDNARVVSRPG